jgi:hypothetical protein
MNISEILPYLPTFITASMLIAFAIIAIMALPWSTKDFYQGQKEVQYIYDVIKNFLKEDLIRFLDPTKGSRNRNITREMT